MGDKWNLVQYKILEYRDNNSISAYSNNSVTSSNWVLNNDLSFVSNKIDRE